jgi:hypothetical protein
MDKQVSAKSTKNEILEAYEELLTKIRDGKTESPQVHREEQQKKETVKGWKPNYCPKPTTTKVKDCLTGM